MDNVRHVDFGNERPKNRRILMQRSNEVTPLETTVPASVRRAARAWVRYETGVLNLRIVLDGGAVEPSDVKHLKNLREAAELTEENLSVNEALMARDLADQEVSELRDSQHEPPQAS